MTQKQKRETQECFGQEPGLHLVAVLCQGVDGHRCYVAAYKMPDLSRVGEMNAETEELWEREKQKAAIFAHRHGNKVPPEGVRMFFAMDPESVEWGTMKKKPMTKAAKWGICPKCGPKDAGVFRLGQCGKM